MKAVIGLGNPEEKYSKTRHNIGFMVVSELLKREEAKVSDKFNSFFAKKAGILCHEFSIGMGPVLFQKKIGETVYSIRAIPIGGFVSMAGEEVNFDALKDVKKVKLEFDANKRIILKIPPTMSTFDAMQSEQIILKGVVDYHGDKTNWYLT